MENLKTLKRILENLSNLRLKCLSLNLSYNELGLEEDSGY